MTTGNHHYTPIVYDQREQALGVPLTLRTSSVVHLALGKFWNVHGTVVLLGTASHWLHGRRHRTTCSLRGAQAHRPRNT